MIRPRRARVTGLCNVRWSRTLNPTAFAFSMVDFFLVALCRREQTVSALHCADALRILGIGDARSAWPCRAERRARGQLPLGGCRWFGRQRFRTTRLLWLGG